MRVLIYEDNLMWSARLAKSLTALGHDAVVLTDPASADGDVAILNLASRSLPASNLAPMLRAAGIRIIAHAGHKEKDLLALGEEMNCDVLATNSQLTWKLPELLEQAKLPVSDQKDR